MQGQDHAIRGPCCRLHRIHPPACGPQQRVTIPQAQTATFPRHTDATEGLFWPFSAEAYVGSAVCAGRLQLLLTDVALVAVRLLLRTPQL